MGREKNNIESNCVAFDDVCFDETNYQSSYQSSIIEMDKKELKLFKKLFQRIFSFGTGKAA